jgi:hypothetical protein
MDSEAFDEKACDTYHAHEEQDQRLAQRSVSSRGFIPPGRDQGEKGPQEDTGPGKISDKGNEKIRHPCEYTLKPVVGQHQVTGHEKEKHESIKEEEMPETRLVLSGKRSVGNDVRYACPYSELLYRLYRRWSTSPDETYAFYQTP